MAFSFNSALSPAISLFSGGPTYKMNGGISDYGASGLGQTTSSPSTASPFSMVNYNGQQVVGPSNSVFNQILQAGDDAYNKAMGTNLSVQQYDAMANPTTYGARYGIPSSAMPQSAPASDPSTTSFGFSSNPYLAGQTTAIKNTQNQLFGDMNNQIRSDAIATGGYGGDRMGVAQGVAMARAATGLDSALAGLYGNAYDSDQNRALQQYGMDQGFYTSQRGQDLQQQMQGATLYGLGQQGMWGPIDSWSQAMSPYTGFGNTTQSQGGGLTGAVGGGLGTWALLNLLNGKG